MNTLIQTVENFREPLADALQELLDSYQLAELKTSPTETSPPLLAEAFTQLLEAMQRTEASLAAQPLAGRRVSSEEVSELGEYALELCDQTLQWAQRLNLTDVQDTLQAFIIAMARWIARHGGQLFILEPVVDALAQTANQSQDTQQLLGLYQAMSEIMAATVAAIRQDLEKNNPGRPWRLLHLNRAIVATRTHQPDIMEEAFSTLAHDLPEDAPRFFSEGMEQMDLLNYPPHVREVMDRYYRKWSVNRALH
jgi:hypothetical protein